MTTAAELEQRIAQLEAIVSEQHQFYMLLLNLLLRHDPRVRDDIVEAIRRILQHQNQAHPVSAYPISAYVQQQLRLLRDDLLRPPPQDLVQAMSQPPVRPVE